MATAIKPLMTAGNYTQKTIGDKKHELKNHLGNVLAVVTDRKIVKPYVGGAFDGFESDLVSYSSYYPFGMEIKALSFNSDSYRYSFQGQEKDDEIKGNGNSVNYKYRMHDPRLGRFFAIDPLTPKYPHYTPYSFSGNKVIHAIELEGLEEYLVIKTVDATRLYYVPLASRISLPNASGVMSRFDGIQYRYKYPGSPEQTINRASFIAQSKEERLSKSESNYYFIRSDAKNNDNRQRGTLGSNGILLAQGRFTKSGAVLTSLITRESAPTLKEFYATNGSNVSDKGQIDVDAVAKYLMTNVTFSVVITGSTDRSKPGQMTNQQGAQFNLNLSQRRANNIMTGIIEAAKNIKDENSKSVYSDADIQNLTNRITTNGVGEGNATRAGEQAGTSNQSYRTTTISVTKNNQ